MEPGNDGALADVRRAALVRGLACSVGRPATLLAMPSRKAIARAVARRSNEAPASDCVVERVCLTGLTCALRYFRGETVLKGGMFLASS